MAKLAAKPTPASTDAQAAQAKIQQSPAFAGIINELNLIQDQLFKRQALIRRIEKALSDRYRAPNRIISYIFRFDHPKSMITSADVAPLDAVLNSISHAKELNIILHSPGGDGSIIEKMVEMCRGHLPRHDAKLRIIVPNIAKSAATLFALGADTIIMGYCSELGPIDPQIRISVSGIVHQISALAFVESRDEIMTKIQEAIKAKEPTAALLQQLAGLNIPFTHEMQNQIDFAEKTAIRLLEKYMLKVTIKKNADREKKAKEIAKKLLSKQLFPIHGHFIDANNAKDDLELSVDILDRTDNLWKLIWEYYIRAEIQMNIPSGPNSVKLKLFESADQSLVTQDFAKDPAN